ncbi:glycosyltransferase [Amylibacter sp.]|nr:glycosyltransferase [Amylibacter sp.]
MKKLLTIGIPTYKREAALKSGISQLLANNVLEIVEILIIDDGGGEFFGDYLGELSAGIKIVKNAKNLGFGRTFLRLFEECTTDYMMVVGDDDLINVESLKPLLQFLSCQPNLVSPQFFQGNTMERGKEETRKIRPIEVLDSCKHGPGLVYKVEACKKGLGILEQRLLEGKTDAVLYPQAVVVAHLLCESEECYWLNLPTAFEGLNLSSNLVDLAGNHYWTFESRCKQLVAFDDLLVSLLGSERSAAMLAYHRRTSFGWLANSLEAQNPALYRGLIASSKNYQRNQQLKALARKIVPNRVYELLRHYFNAMMRYK